MTDGALPGRDQLYKLIWSELLKRVDKGAQRPLPVVVLGGPRGSGKTSMLDLLTVRCRQQDLQPFVPALNLEQGTFGDRGWQVIDWIARQLGGQSWPTFGRLRFPRFALGRIIVEGAVDVRTLQQTQDDIARLLRQASGLEQIAAGLNNIARQLPDQLLGIPTGASSLRLVGVVGARLVNSQLAAKLRFHTGMAFYGKVMASQANGGFNALAALSQLRLSNGDAARSTVNEMLCRAFLADLAEAYRRGFHPRNCLVLVDNLDSADGGKELITALVKAKSEAAPEKPDPLLLVATSRRTTALSPLLTADAPDVPVEQHFYPDRMVRVSDFDPRPGAQRSWLYPVRLTDLDQRTVEKLAVSLYPARVDLAAFVFSLTRGHPWSVVQTLATLNALAQESARQLDEHELRAVLDSPCPGAGRKLGDHAVEYLLLEDLDQPLRSLMPACAAAVDVVTAQRTRLAQGQQLENELAQRQWLVAGPASAGGNATLHPWLRRLLLRLLASPDTGKSLLAQQTTWTIAHEAARRATPPKTAAALHYDLALGRFDGPVDWLADRLAQVTKEISVDEWIDDLVLVTSAPHETVSDLSAFDWYIDLMSRCTNAAITREPIKEFLLQVVIARWIWADPLGDPTLELKTTLENAFQNLASKCPAGARRLTDIGNAHKEGARP